MNHTSETQAVAIRESSAVGQALGVNDILAQVKLIQEVMTRVMTDGEHYGVIPGTGTKKTLLQPGAQKLTMTFRLAPEYELQETNLPREHKEYRVICTLKSIQTGNFVGQGVGCCSTMESKYRFRGGARKCPNCGKETIIKGKKEYGGGWLCFTKKNGCGSKWEDGDPEIEGQSVERVECENPADFYNTVLKMAKKRAFVDATITATAASDIFTQDVGDDDGDGNGPQAPTMPPASSFKPQTAPIPPQEPKTAAEAPSKRRTPAEEEELLTRLETWLAHCKANLIAKLEPVLGGAKEYAQKSGWIMDNELFKDTPITKLFPSVDWTKSPSQNGAAVVKDFNEFTENVRKFMDGDPVPGDVPKVEVPRDLSPPPPQVDEWFMKVIVPVPHKGQKRDEYLKNPDTIGSLYDQRHGADMDAQTARERLYGFLHHYQPEGWVKRDGTKMPPSDSDKLFREALDAFGEFLEKNGEKI